MTRVLFALLGTGLMIAWLVGMVTETSPWLRWVDFVAGSFSFLVAMSPVFTGTVGRRDSAAFAWALTAVLGTFYVVEWLVRATPWLTWTTLVFAVLYAAAAMKLSSRTA